MTMTRHLDGISAAVATAFSESSVVPARADSALLLDRNAVRIRIEVPDMVRPLQRHTIMIDTFAVKSGGLRAFGVPIGKLAAQLNEERDVRRWSSCDP